MKLDSFKINNYRSIKNTSEIETKNITALIGENESGKTNVLLPLWKLNPATNSPDSKIKLLDDYPRNCYHLIYNTETDNQLRLEKFIKAKFSLDEKDKEKVNNDFSIDVDTIILSRDYNSKLHIELIDIDNNNILEKLFKDAVDNAKKLINTESSDAEILTNISKGSISKTMIETLSKSELKCENLCQILKTYLDIQEDLKDLNNSKIYDLIPKFIYYSDYGNLDSEIYLPDVIANYSKDTPKNRTLKTLFQFVNLSPQDIYEMGKTSSNPTEEQKKDNQYKINERQTLLESAATAFSKSFNDWWGQGNYSFKFEIDGNYFRIKVSDAIRRESIELEHRSRGLQWFFSFYLVFLVESQNSHKNCILLLDEPGVTLHPNSQKDLYKFFENLSLQNQLIYTTHSPFMINPNQLDMVYAVYVDNNGYSTVTSDLRHTGNKKQDSSIYPAFAALGLNVSDTLLQGCIPVIVEGISDQIYFSLIKNALISKNILGTNKEIVFIPSTGVKGIKSILSLLSCIESSQYPYVILDGDEAGQTLKDSLCQNLYAGNETKLLSIYDYKENSEVEDLLPSDLFVDIASSYLPRKENIDDNFKDVAEKGSNICDQIQLYCKNNDISLSIGYKVEIAKKFKTRLLKKNKNVYDEMDETQQIFIKNLFKKLTKNN